MSMLRNMLHVISGMTDDNKLDKLLAAIIARMVEIHDTGYAADRLNAALNLITMGEEWTDGH
jgi:hypothetical protein